MESRLLYWRIVIGIAVYLAAMFSVIAAGTIPENFGYAVLAVVCYVVVTLSIVKYRRLRKVEQFSDVLVSPRGREYPFTMGDELVWYRDASDAAFRIIRERGKGAFNGLEVQVPRAFPHVYLDNLRANGKKMLFVFDASQKVRLEGGFDSKFMLYAPKGYEVLALSAISPDVMQTLLSQDNTFDIELDGHYVRIISHKDVTSNVRLQQALMSVAQLLLAEFDTRISWNRLAADPHALQAKLIMYPFRGIRIAGHYILWRWIAYVPYVVMCTGVLLAVVIVAAMQGLWGLAMLMALLFFASTGAFMAFIIRTDRTVRFISNNASHNTHEALQYNHK